MTRTIDIRVESLDPSEKERFITVGIGDGVGSGLTPTIVTELPKQGSSNILYLIEDGTDTGIYKTYIWLGTSYGETSCGAHVTSLDWENIDNKPEFLDVVHDTEDDSLEFVYRRY